MLFPYHVNHLTLNWRVPLHRGAMQFLARHFAVINLDFPGAGLSRPLDGDLSLASGRVNDFETTWCKSLL